MVMVETFQLSVLRSVLREGGEVRGSNESCAIIFR